MKIISYNFVSDGEWPTCIVNDGTKDWTIRCYRYGVYFFDVSDGKIVGIFGTIPPYNAILDHETRYSDEDLDKKLKEVMAIAQISERVENIIDVLNMSNVL